MHSLPTLQTIQHQQYQQIPLVPLKKKEKRERMKDRAITQMLPPLQPSARKQGPQLPPILKRGQTLQSSGAASSCSIKASPYAQSRSHQLLKSHQSSHTIPATYTRPDHGVRQILMLKERARSKIQKEKSAREFASIRSSSNKLNPINYNSNYAGGAASTGKKKNNKSIGLKGADRKQFQSLSGSILHPENQQLMRAQSYQGNLPLITKIQPIQYGRIDPERDDDVVIEETDEALLDPFDVTMPRKTQEDDCALDQHETEVKEAGNMILQLYQQKLLQQQVLARYRIFNQEDPKLPSHKDESVPSSVKSKCSSKQVDGQKGIVYNIDEFRPKKLVVPKSKIVQQERAQSQVGQQRKDDIETRVPKLSLDLQRITRLQQRDDVDVEESYHTTRNSSERNEKK